MPFQRIGNGLEVGVGVGAQEALQILFNGRELGTRQGRLEARVLHQFPGLQLDAPGLGKPLMVAVLVAQLLEEHALGRHIGGQTQGGISQCVARLRLATRRGPGHLVVGEETQQPGIFPVIAGGNCHGALNRHGKARIKRIRYPTPPGIAAVDGGEVTLDRQRDGVGNTVLTTEYALAPATQGIETPGLQALQGTAAPGRQVGLAIAARTVGGVEVIPLALGIATAAIGGIATAAVRLAVEGG